MAATEKDEMIIGVVDYGAGNLGNVVRALSRLGYRHDVLSAPQNLGEAGSSIVLVPGVGAFPQAMRSMTDRGWVLALKDWAHAGRPLLGICIGMQLLCDSSAEDGFTEGLGLLSGEVKRLSGTEKIPHMGWNEVEWRGQGRDQPGESSFYFVHGYAVETSPDCIGETEVDGVRFASALRRRNVAGFQFHPERSGPDGVRFLGGWLLKLNDVYGKKVR